MKIKLYQVDAFTRRAFAGNPAAVCPLTGWPADAVMQAIAAENNLSETAFLVPEDGNYRIRWFTPRVEVELCGHATLASAFVVFAHLEPGRTAVTFQSLSGPLSVTGDGERLVIDFPAIPTAPCTPPAELIRGLGAEPSETRAGEDYLAIFETAGEVAALAPDFAILAGLPKFGVIATAPGGEGDFVSRFFAPAKGIDEDPVTGRAHCVLAPYWAERLGKQRLGARQISARGGALTCEMAGDRVRLCGACVLFLEGTIHL